MSHSPSPADQWRAQLASAQLRAQSSEPIARSGHITKATGLVLEATGLQLPLGAACRIQVSKALDHWAHAEVVGFEAETLYLMPHHEIMGLRPGALVLPIEPITESALRLNPDAAIEPPPAPALAHQLPVGAHLLGRVVDAAGQALDGLGSLEHSDKASLNAKLINPLARTPITQTMDVGVRAINGLLSIGRGQRMGLFAGSGVGKSVLLGMMARYTEADVIVVGLIGERGREVKEFIEHNLGPQGLARSVVVAAPADVSPLLRLQGAVYATRIAEYFRDQGQHVLLIMDSLTRYAMAQREIALAVGEPPATKGYPPSVFNKLPALVERAGNGAQSDHGAAAGSITAFYTVLTEGDDQQDPIADSARAILDGHVVLSRRLADSGHYPAIDVEASISRVMSAVVSAEHIKLVHQFKQILSIYQRNRDLIAVGAYQRGNDPTIDNAIERYPWLESFLRQDVDNPVSFEKALDELQAILGVTGHA
ncbi:MAG TPA: flagellar protein export ATPase FliI [Paenalcaligenes hominis]|uniref:Flagellum-specific ATP synthase n=1 Tax=Paenalcaligenes hominis TaxID=643674 RepID=A0A9D2VG05_9BURK|nr:flagellar protein export ATPase FliI [Paenalcaligenes hominis]NJB65952.1 flagellum-specific ATP synthase [Paenalcaligenes hominis]GGE70974.1 flagellar protein export ATPase FliI [Paenalcaligenes hominis]HJH24293.1 flagellar protein export ATPase FliI [Paenalcaligenes hominis]